MLAVQLGKIKAYAQLYDVDVLEVVEDRDQSGKSLARPGLQSVLELLESGQVDGVLVASLDRLTRSVRDLGDLLDRGFKDRWQLLSVQEQVDTRTASGRLVLNILATISQWERETIGERTKATMAHLKAQGVHCGRAPYGYRHSEELDAHGRRLLVIEEQEQTVIAAIMANYAAGISLRQIAAQLDAGGLRTREGKTWTHVQVSRIVNSQAA
jgi:DNA invertase Pin-like site-specific DNA recombinase